MEKDKTSNEKTRSLVTACIILVVGILFSCSMSFGVKGLSYLIGATLIISGIISTVNSIIQKRALLTAEGLTGAALVAFGIMFIVREMAGIIVDFIPWLMISVGIALVIDSILKKFVSKTISTTSFVCELVTAALTAALGFCIKFINGWADFAALILGIVLIAYALTIILGMIFNNAKNKK